MEVLSIRECLNVLTENELNEEKIDCLVKHCENIAEWDMRYFEHICVDLKREHKIKLLAAAFLRENLINLEMKSGKSYFNMSHMIELIKEKMRFLDVEQFYGFYFDSNMKLIEQAQISVGTVDAAILMPRDVFRYACYYNACSVVIAHNHPSGDPTPGENDILLTKRIIESGKIMGISLVDHIVVGKNEAVSIRKEKLVDF